MTLSQLSYIVAIDEERHFVSAAARCNITQATLSMMVKKLEGELNVKIFDRSKQPVRPTREGEQIILRSRQVLLAADGLKAYSRELRGEVTGELRLAVIPTVAPYLLPLFLRNFSDKFPYLKIFIRELVTDDVVDKLEKGEIDMGILATPLNEAALEEHVLFSEDFFAYASKSEKMRMKKYLLPSEINVQHLWLLEEGHCMRNQVLDLCELKRQSSSDDMLHYEAGTIETLINLVDRNEGITIIPKLAALMLSAPQAAKLVAFADPKPVRQISIVTIRNFPRMKLLENLKKEIIESLPEGMRGSQQLSRSMTLKPRN